MALIAEDLAKFAGVDLQTLDEEPSWETGFDGVLSAFNGAVVLVDDTLSGAWRPVPEAVRDRLVLEVGHALLKRQDSPSGASQGVEFGTGQPVMGARDPLAQVWPIIRRYVLPL